MRFNYVFLLLIFILVQNASAQIVNRMDDATFDAIDQQIVSRFNANNLTGLSVGIVYGGELVFAKGYGVRNESNDPFTIYTKSLMASVSKTITGIMAMRMIEDGNLGLDDLIEDYVAGYDDSGITIRHLLTHQSGIDHYNTCPDGYDGPFNWFSSWLLIQDCGTCMVPPGSGTLYTTHGTTLLGAIIDVVGASEYGSGFEELYEDWIRAPGGLTTLVPAWNNNGVATGYDEDGDVIGDDFEDIGWKLPAGGFTSNILDMAEYAKGIMNNTFVSSSTGQSMWVLQPVSGSPIYTCNSASSNDFGLAFRISGTDNNTVIWHNGLNSHGYSSYLYVWPYLGAAIVMLCNNYNQTDVLNAIRQDVDANILCPGNRTFTTDIEWNSPLIYEASNQITGESLIGTFSGVVTFDAQTRVVLKPGFHALPGTKFLTVVDDGGCGGNVLPY